MASQYEQILHAVDLSNTAVSIQLIRFCIFADFVFVEFEQYNMESLWY